MDHSSPLTLHCHPRHLDCQIFLLLIDFFNTKRDLLGIRRAEWRKDLESRRLPGGRIEKIYNPSSHLIHFQQGETSNFTGGNPKMKKVFTSTRYVG